MKLVLATVLLGAFLSTQAVRAEEAHPCKKIKDACEAAGFKPGQAKQKNGLMMNCMKPVMDGQKVKDVNVTDAEVAACKEMKGKHSMMKEHMKDMHKEMHKEDAAKPESKAEEKK